MEGDSVVIAGLHKWDRRRARTIWKDRINRTPLSWNFLVIRDPWQLDRLKESCTERNVAVGKLRQEAILEEEGKEEESSTTQYQAEFTAYE